MTFRLVTLILMIGFTLAVVSAGASPARAAEEDATVGERIFDFVDKNGDASIDPKEFGGLSASMKAWLIEHTFDGTAAISRKAFVAVSGRMMADLRRGRYRIGAAAPSRGGTGSTAMKPTTSTGDPSKSDEPVEYEAKVPAATAGLPAEYQDGDLNNDGQIDFFEWRRFKRAEMSRFYALDENQDNVLSLAEMTGAQPSSSSPSDEYIKKVKSYFIYMDKNENEKLDADEWEASERIKPAFEKADIDLKKPMTETDFVAHYLKIYPTEEDEKKSKSDGRSEQKRKTSTFGGFGGRRQRR